MVTLPREIAHLQSPYSMGFSPTQSCGAAFFQTPGQSPVAAQLRSPTSLTPSSRVISIGTCTLQNPKIQSTSLTDSSRRSSLPTPLCTSAEQSTDNVVGTDHLPLSSPSSSEVNKSETKSCLSPSASAYQATCASDTTRKRASLSRAWHPGILSDVAEERPLIPAPVVTPSTSLLHSPLVASPKVLQNIDFHSNLLGPSPRSPSLRSPTSLRRSSAPAPKTIDDLLRHRYTAAVSQSPVASHCIARTPQANEMPSQSPRPTLQAGADPFFLGGETSMATSNDILTTEVVDKMKIIDSVLNPLAIRFSQPRINPVFSDGLSFEDAVMSCNLVSCHVEFSPSVWTERSLLQPPFPAIEVIRWRPKLRHSDGTAKLDPKTKLPLKGEERWFTMDNRRLHCLQRAAVDAWPRVCCVEVKVIPEVVDDRKFLGKFRTTTEGANISVATAKEDGWIWDWRSTLEVAKGKGALQEASISASKDEPRMSPSHARVRAESTPGQLTAEKVAAPVPCTPEVKVVAAKQRTVSAKPQAILGANTNHQVVKGDKNPKKQHKYDGQQQCVSVYVHNNRYWSHNDAQYWDWANGNTYHHQGYWPQATWTTPAETCGQWAVAGGRIHKVP